MSQPPVTSPRTKSSPRLRKPEQKVASELYDKKAAEAESKERAAELARVAKIKAEREKQEKIQAEMKRLQIPRLLAIKGVRRLRPVVVLLDATSISRRDHFLLETETHLFHYKGEFAPFTTQRTKAVENAQKALQKERMVPLKLVSVKPDDSKETLFWETLKGNKFSISEGVGDNVWELKYNQAFKLYRYDQEIGLLPEEDVSCSKLDKKSIFVVAAPGELYVWYGKETGLLRRNHAKSQAIAVYKKQEDNSNDWVQIREIHQGSEDYVFRQKFPDWVEMSATGVPLDPQVLLEIFSRKMLDFNPAKVTQIEDVDGSLDIWVAKDHGKVPISKVSYGEFFNSNSYIVLYQSDQGRVIYFWQGSLSHVSWDHAAESIKAVQKIALLSVDLLRRTKTTIPVVRVSEGDEPPHLLALFNGAFIVRHGKFDSFDRRLLLMYHIRGTDPYSCRVTECSLSRKALRSEDAFIAYSPKTMFVWRGKNCSKFPFKVAKRLAERFVAVETVMVEEGKENDEFWDMLGGKVQMKEMEKKRVKGRKCSKCSHGNPADCKFCRKCGAVMADKKSRQSTSDSSIDTSSSSKITSTKSEANLPSVSVEHPSQPEASKEDLASLVGISSGAMLTTKPSLALPGRRSSRRNSVRVKKNSGPVKVCPQCSRKNPPTGKFCRGCGHNMTDVKESSDVSQSEGESGNEKTLRRASTRKNPSVPADISQSEGDSGSEKTLRRGSTRKRPQEADVAGAIPCPSCAKKNLPGVKFCKYCGSNIAVLTGPKPADQDAGGVAAPAAVPIPVVNVVPVAEAVVPPVVTVVETSVPLPVVVPAGAAQIICAACGTSNDDTDKFCSGCAEPLKKTAAVPVAAASETLRMVPLPQEIRCPSCGVANEVGCKFCLECGENLQSLQPHAQQPVSQPPIVPIPIASVTDRSVSMPVVPVAVSTAAAAVSSEVQCSVCKTWNEPGCKFCADCGETLVAVANGGSADEVATPSKKLPAPEATDQSANAVKCPKCRRPNAAGQKFCRKCGWELAKARKLNAASPSPGEEVKVKKDPTHDCRQCGAANPIDTIFCKKCGMRFADLKSRNPADEIAKLRRANSSYNVLPTVKQMTKQDRGVRCSDPACDKPNKPGDEKCRVCGKALPTEPKSTENSPAKASNSSGKVEIPAAIAKAAEPLVGPAGQQLKKDGSLQVSKSRFQMDRVDSSAFLKKKDKVALEDQVGDWLKRRDEAEGGSAGVGDAAKKLEAAKLNTSSNKLNTSMNRLGSSSNLNIGSPGKLSIVQAKMKAMEEKAAAEKAKAEEEKRKKEEEAAALEARKWVKPKLFIVHEGNIIAKRSVLQVHLKNPLTQVLIDAKDIVWLWCGPKTNPDQEKFARDLAKFYCDVVLKDSNRKAVVQEAKNNMDEFVKLFQGWEYEDDAPKRQMHFSVALPKVVQHVQLPGEIPVAGDSVATATAAAAVASQPTDSASATAAAPVDGATVADPAAATSDGQLGEIPNSMVAPAPASAPSVTIPPVVAATTQEVLGMYMCYFPLERLQDPQSLPPTLNMSSLETYLTDEDFLKTFKMKKDEFAALPAWRKVAMKKKALLF